MIVPISPRARKYGYLIWPSSADQEIRGLLGESKTVQVTFRGQEAGMKNVDWKHRRISIGPRLTRELPEEMEVFALEFENSTLNITCR